MKLYTQAPPPVVSRPGNELLISPLSEKLRAWRRQKASALGMPPYIVLHNAVLEEIAAQQPQSLDELKRVKGIGETKIETYDTEILAFVQSLNGALDAGAATLHPLHRSICGCKSKSGHRAARCRTL